MIDPVRDLATLHEATERLLRSATPLDNAALAAPSRLPGWSRGHVLAHLARNAEAVLNVLEGRPMYPDEAAREADIERDAPRPADAQLTDVRDTAARFEAAAALPVDWSRTVALRNGVTDRAARLPFRRLVEVELHHVDLDAGTDLEDLPAEFTERETEFLAERFSGHAALPPITLRTAAGGLWRTGGRAGTPLSVEGPAPELMGWLAGRRTGSALECTGGPLPVLPPL